MRYSDWQNEFEDDQSFLSNTLELMIDKLHQYASESDFGNAETVAERIREVID